MRNIIHHTKDKKYYNPQHRKKVAQNLYTKALDHFISFLTVKDGIISFYEFFLNQCLEFNFL